jgi:predicted nucleotide-binding protein
MTKKSTAKSIEQPTLELLFTQDDAKTKILERIEKGKEIRNGHISSLEQLELVRNNYQKWSDFNTELLNRLFTNESLSKEYSRTPSAGFFSLEPEALEVKIEGLREKIDEKIHRLDSIVERLELFPLSDSVMAPRTQKTLANFQNESVFIVHGHDEGARETTARFLEKLGIQPIILHEQVSGGRTILEKLEHHSSVDFAIILLTPDDVGAAKTSSDKLSPRARQNVIMELGYFLNKLGRERVCALHKGHVELPSDFLGVVYVPMDDNGGWRLQVAKELKEVGFSIDMNKVM